MTKHECRMTKEVQMTKFKKRQRLSLYPSFELRHSFVIRHCAFVISLRFICSGTFENQMQRLRRVQSVIELSLQCALGFGGQSGFCCLFPG
jgi:hypothetical protein